MTLAKKKSRAIEVNGVSYRYQVSTTRMDGNGNFSLNVTVQLEQGVRQVLKVVGLITRNDWLDGPMVAVDADRRNYPVLMPKHIAKLIKLALSEGWNPELSGPPHDLHMQNDELFEKVKKMNDE